MHKDRTSCVGAFFRAHQWPIVLLVALLIVRLLFHASPDFRMAAWRFRAWSYGQPFYPHGDKYWAHQCNDIRMLEEMLPIYEGAEVDLVFFPSEDGGCFHMSHEVEDRVDNPLENALRLLSLSRKTKLWLDFKNLSGENASLAASELDRLTAQYRIDKKRLIVESPNDVQLGIFRQRGYYTSYYCPTDEYYLTEKGAEVEFKKKILQVAESGNVNALSFPEVFYPLAKGAGTNLDLLTWYSSDPWRFFFFPVQDDDRKERHQGIENDPQVRVILVNPHSRYES